MNRPNSDMPARPPPKGYTREQEIRVLAVLDKIVTSGVLGVGERMPALLRYIVREELAGRGDRIKSFSIATEVLGRGQSFDPQSDSIARAEMTRLRKCIDHYNASLGAADQVHLSIPKGSYKPLIAFGRPLLAPPLVTVPEGAAGAPKTGLSRLAAGIIVSLGLLFAVVALVWQQMTLPGQAFLLPPLVVMQPSEPGAEARLGQLAHSVQAEIAAELSRQPWLTVIQPGRLEEVTSALTTASASRAVYLLDVRLSPLDPGFRATAFLKRWPDQAVRWSTSRDTTSLADYSSKVLRDVANEIARDIAAPGGALTMVEVARHEGSERYERRFVCLMTLRRYWRSYDIRLRNEAEECLGAALTGDPNFASGRAAIALLAIERAREARGDDRARLLAEAQKQLASTPGSGLLADDAQLALAACVADLDRVRTMADHMIKAYPNNPDVLADVGSKLGLVLGDWPHALAAEARALALNPAPDPWYPLATIAKAVLDGEPQRAVALLAQAPQRGFPIGHVIRLAVGGGAGDAIIVADARGRLDDLGIRDNRAALQMIDGQCWSDAVKQAFARGVEAAGR